MQNFTTNPFWFQSEYEPEFKLLEESPPLYASEEEYLKLEGKRLKMKKRIHKIQLSNLCSR